MNGDDMDQSLRPTRLMLYVVGALVILRVISLIIVKRFYTSAPIITTQTISIVVLGDIGRSPRIQYHALSFAEAGFLVDLIGYAGIICDGVHIRTTLTYQVRNPALRS